MTQSVADVCRVLREYGVPYNECMEAADLLEAQSAVVSQAQEVWNGLGKSRTFADALSGLGTALKDLHALSEKRDE